MEAMHSELTPHELVGQFLLCKDAGAIPKGWQLRRHGPWCLGSHPSLPVIEMVAADSSRIGWLLGWPLSLAGAVVENSCVFGIPPSDDAASPFESCLYEYAGRYAAVLLLPGVSRFYLDPCASLAAVFCRSQEIVASTPTLIPPAGDENQELTAAVMVPGHDNWYPFGLTPRRGVTRLLPNHFLDLQRWQIVRHWPRGEIVESRDVNGAVAQFAQIVSSSIRAVAKRQPFYCCLTGGRDSRVLLACAREVLDEGTWFTVAAPTPAAKTDCQIAKRLRKRLGLKHVFLPFQPLSPAEQAVFAYRTGGCVNGLVAPLLRAFRVLDARRPVLWGQAGELGRAFHWRTGDDESSPISVPDLLRRMARLSLPWSHAEVHAQAEQWATTLPVKNTLTRWGLLYNEQYNGCFQGPMMYGNAHSVCSIWPLCHRRAIEIMLSLPREYRRRLMFERDVIASRWPELLAVPFNWPLGLRRCLFFVSRRAQATWHALVPSAAGQTHG